MNLQSFSPYQKRVLLVLTLVNFVNWIDRQIVYPLFPRLPTPASRYWFSFAI